MTINNPTNPVNYKRPAWTRNSSNRKGAVLLITIIGLTAFVGLVFFVLNMGIQINRRISAQNSADSAVISGSGWMARSMNVIAMNNVTTTRLIALVCVMDALPVAAEMTIAEETGDQRLPQALEMWSRRNNRFTRWDRDNFFLRGLQEIYRNMNQSSNDSAQLDLLVEIDQRFDHPDEMQTEGGYNVTRTTNWDGPAGRGFIWQAMLALDTFSQVIIDNASSLAQENATLFAEQNGANNSILFPLKPKILAKRGTWYDYGVPLMDYITYRYDHATSQLRCDKVSSNIVSFLRTAFNGDTARSSRHLYVRGGAIPDMEFPYRLGPFARLYRWRDYIDQYNGAEYGREFVERWGYRTFGPLRHMLRRVVWNFGSAGRHWGDGILDTSRFAWHLQNISQVKLAYLFGLQAPIRVQYCDRWITNYHDAEKFVEEDRKRMQLERDRNNRLGLNTPVRSNVMVTRYYRVNVKSTVPFTDTGAWMNPASWQSQPPTDTFTPRRWWSWQLRGRGPYSDPSQQHLHRWFADSYGWRSMGRPMSFGQTPQLGRWVEMDNSGQSWFRQTRREVVFDNELGLPPRPIYNDKNEIVDYIKYTIYAMQWRVFGGIEVRNEHAISSPVYGANLSDMPKPVLMDTSMGDYTHDRNSGVRAEHFTYRGLSSSNARPKFWARKFRSGSPTNQMVAVAQSEIFNNRSWGLWTQDWQSQLMPISNWNLFVDGLREQGYDSNNIADISTADLEELTTCLESINADLVDEYMKH